MTLVCLVLESLTDGIFSERTTFVPPKLLWKRNSGKWHQGASSQHRNKPKHLSEHKWNVLSMQKQTTMQTEKIFSKLQA